MSSVLRLNTIPASHYCEKARWALQRAGVCIQEVGAMPLLHYRLTALRGMGRSVPMLESIDGYGNSGTTSGTTNDDIRSSSNLHSFLPDSDAIMAWAHQYSQVQQQAAAAARSTTTVAADATASALYPSGRSNEAADFERYLGSKLGPQTRRFAYWQIFRPDTDPSVASKILAANTSLAERVFAPLLSPVIAAGIVRALNISETKAVESEARVRGVFEVVGNRLADAAERCDGGEYLGGNQFSGTDLTFAALASLVLLPPEAPLSGGGGGSGGEGDGGGAIFGLEQLAELDPSAAKVVEELRDTPAGRHAMRGGE
eukprot:UC1_evm2s1134